MKLLRNSGLAALLVLLSGSQAHAFGLNVEGGLGWTSPSTDNPAITNISSKMAVGFGGSIELGLVPFFSLDVGALYMPRKFQFDSPLTTGIVESANYLQIPVLLRFSVINMLSVGGGFYYATGMGNVGTTAQGVALPDQTFSQSGLNSSDFGLVFSGRFRIPLMPTLGAFVDGRYLYGLSNNSSDTTTSFKYRDIQALFGLNFSL